MGKIIKNKRITPVRRINPRQENIVIFVDLFRFDINPDLLLIKSPSIKFTLREPPKEAHYGANKTCPYFFIITHFAIYVKWGNLIIC